VADDRALDPQHETAPASIVRRLDMSLMCWFFHYTPAEYRALKLRDWRELHDFMIEHMEAQ
jgi:hypothetical protein